MEFLKAIEKNKDKLIKDLVKLLQFDTVGIEDFDNKAAPFGEGVRDALLYMLVLGEKEGFKTKNIDNVAGHIEYGEGEEIIGVLTHLDVVPPGDGWKFPPFSGHIEDGKIYARGALDDKGPAMASFYALKIIKDLGLKLNKKVRLIFGTDEESGMRGIERYLEVCEKPELGFSPDANFPLIYGEKGIMSIDIISKEVDKNLEALDAGDRYNLVPDKAVLKTKKALENEFNKYLEEENFQGKIDDDKLILYGESAHAMEPEKGVNALVNLAKFVSGFHDNKLIKFIDECLSDTRFKTIGLDFKDKEMGDLTLNVAFAKMSSEGGKVGLNLRYPINWKQDKFIKELTKLASKYDLEVKLVSDSKPHFVNKKSKLVKTLHEAYVKYTNDKKTKLMTIGGGTYARMLGNAVAFGMLMPGREDVVHKVNEHIYIEDLLVSTAIYAQAIYQLGK